MLIRRTLVSAVALGVALVLAAGSAGDSPQSVEISAPTFTLDQPAHVTVTVVNEGETALHVRRVDLGSELARSLELTGTTPAHTSFSVAELNGASQLGLALEVPAKGRAEIGLDVIPRVTGNRSGSISVCFVEEDASCASGTLRANLPGPDVKLLELTVEAPDKVAVGQDFDLVLRVKNNGIRDDALVDVGLGEDFLAAVDVTSVEPAAASDEEAFLGGWTWNYGRPIPAQGELVVTVHGTAKEAAKLDEYVNVCIESELLCKQPDFDLVVQ